ncbi:hypothetical protein WJU23_00570 [Prosthecobacter sp. SYSU 5D2]|uniref:hypothetical protein n=1 Tax=Prosthecobacter sp. SYSU 5D2 TaxID=3134134 RepID=UPI0031FE95BE
MKTDDLQKQLAWRLNWYRQSELEGALLLGRMAGLADGAFLCQELTRHAAEEAAHAQLWADAIGECGLPHIRILRSYQSFYLHHSGPPASLMEVLSFTQIFERRVHLRFQAELANTALPAPARHAFSQMIEDEKHHLSWVARWLRSQPGSAESLRRYQEIDLAVYQELIPYEHQLHALPGLGRE